MKHFDTYTENAGAFAMSMKLSNKAARWLVDTGASSHMTQRRELLTDYKEFENPEKVNLGDGCFVDAVGVGNIYLKMLFKVSEPKKSVMYEVLYVPKLACNLFSVRAAASKGNIVKFGKVRCWIRDSKGILRGMGSLIDKLYQLDCESIIHEQASVASDIGSAGLWHQRLGHISGQHLKEMVSNEMVTRVKIPVSAEFFFCEGCIEGKMQRKPFKPVGEIRSTRKLQRVHSDVCGPMATESIGKQKYFVTFIDDSFINDFSRCCSVCFIRNKSEVFEKFKEFEALVTNDCNQRICVLWSDNDGEYVSEEFEAYLKLKGIRHELTVPHTPEQNGVAERMNRTLMESARCMISHAGLPDSYWAEAVATADYTTNCTALEKMTPYEQ